MHEVFLCTIYRLKHHILRLSAVLCHSDSLSFSLPTSLRRPYLSQQSHISLPCPYTSPTLSYRNKLHVLYLSAGFRVHKLNLRRCFWRRAVTLPPSLSISPASAAAFRASYSASPLSPPPPSSLQLLPCPTSVYSRPTRTVNAQTLSLYAQQPH